MLLGRQIFKLGCYCGLLLGLAACPSSSQRPSDHDPDQIPRKPDIADGHLSVEPLEKIFENIWIPLDQSYFLYENPEKIHGVSLVAHAAFVPKALLWENENWFYTPDNYLSEPYTTKRFSRGLIVQIDAVDDLHKKINFRHSDELRNFVLAFMPNCHAVRIPNNTQAEPFIKATMDIENDIEVLDLQWRSCRRSFVPLPQYP